MAGKAANVSNKNYCYEWTDVRQSKGSLDVHARVLQDINELFNRMQQGVEAIALRYHAEVIAKDDELQRIKVQHRELYAKYCDLAITKSKKDTLNDAAKSKSKMNGNITGKTQQQTKQRKTRSKSKVASSYSTTSPDTETNKETVTQPILSTYRAEANQEIITEPVTVKTEVIDNDYGDDITEQDVTIPKKTLDNSQKSIIIEKTYSLNMNSSSNGSDSHSILYEVDQSYFKEESNELDYVGETPNIETETSVVEQMSGVKIKVEVDEDSPENNIMFYENNSIASEETGNDSEPPVKKAKFCEDNLVENSHLRAALDANSTNSMRVSPVAAQAGTTTSGLGSASSLLSALASRQDIATSTVTTSPLRAALLNKKSKGTTVGPQVIQSAAQTNSTTSGSILRSLVSAPPAPIVNIANRNPSDASSLSSANNSQRTTTERLMELAIYHNLLNSQTSPANRNVTQTAISTFHPNSASINQNPSVRINYSRLDNSGINRVENSIPTMNSRPGTQASSALRSALQLFMNDNNKKSKGGQ